MPIVLQPLAEAVGKISAKTPVGSILRTAEWEMMPLALRERAFFSAGVESVRLLQEMQDLISDSLAFVREQAAGGEALVDRSSFIGRMRERLAEMGVVVDPDLQGGLQDITSRKRLGLIFDMQVEQAREFARWKAEQDEDVLDAYPAQELVRIEDRQIPRNWRDRWANAGGRFFNGRMVARKSDPIWTRINRFGVPWPPFDFNSGMGLEDVSRDAAEELGVIGIDEIVSPQEEDLNARLEASLHGINPRFREALQNLFGDQVEMSGDTIRWKGGER